MQWNKLVGLTALAFATAAFAQQPAQQTTSSTTPSAAQTTTRSTTAMPGTPSTPAQTETTTQSTATTPTDLTGTPSGPSQSSTTTSTTTSPGAAQAATAADVKTGLAVNDPSGGLVGKIVSVSGKNAVVNTGTVRAAIPLASFAKNDKGLVIGMTKAQIDEEARKSAPKRK